jgi:hypothetical protein
MLTAVVQLSAKPPRRPRNIRSLHNISAAWGRVCVGPDCLHRMRRAFEGACWALGISTRPAKAEPIQVQAVRRAAMRAVLESAAAGVCEAQLLKRLALSKLRPFLARGFSLSAA